MGIILKIFGMFDKFDDIIYVLVKFVMDWVSEFLCRWEY